MAVSGSPGIGHRFFLWPTRCNPCPQNQFLKLTRAAYRCSSNGTQQWGIKMVRNFIVRPIVASLFAFTLLLSGPGYGAETNSDTPESPELDAFRFAVYCISNELTTAKTYQRRWGNEPWTTIVVQPGMTKIHSWKLDTILTTQVPTPQVRFDSDMQGGETFAITYRMQPQFSPDKTCDSAKRYSFQYDGSTRRFVDLRSTN